jgi:hypothetical protein
MLNNITDNLLARFIEGSASDAENCEVLDAIRSEEDLETILLSLCAEAVTDEEEDSADMPTVKLLSSKNTGIRYFEPLPMTGFLGDSINKNDSDSDNETEK